MSETQGSQPAPVEAADPQSQAPAQVGTPGANPVSGDLTKEAAREAIRKLKIKHADGNEEEVAEDEVLKVYRERKGHQKAANKELQEGKAAKKQAETLLQLLKDKERLPAALEKVGYTRLELRQMAESLLAAELEDELMDPREKELKQAKTKLQQYEEMEKKQKEMMAKRRDDELKKKYSEDYSKQFVDALKETKLPPTKAMVAEMAKYISRSAKIGFEMTAKEAAQLVKEDIENTYKGLYGESDAETLVRLLGDQGLQKIRSYDTSRLKDPMANLRTPEGQGETAARERNKPTRMTEREFQRMKRGL